MERRKSERKSVNLSVYLSLPGQSAVWCAVGDISSVGIFLKTNPLHVSRNKQVGLVFALRRKSSNVVHVHRMSATVARTEPEGIGMKFRPMPVRSQKTSGLQQPSA